MPVTYCNPVGLTAAERDSGVFPPGDWFDATGIRIYDGPGGKAWHTGADLNCNRPTWNADAHSPVYAIQDGVVLDAREWIVWGNIMIIDHGTAPDGKPVIARYAHVEQMLVQRGESVRKGQQIARIGNGYQGSQPYHLHFDISFTDVLRTRPNDWPGMDEKRLRDNYLDPNVFMRKYSSADTPVKLTVHGGLLNIRASATVSSADIGDLANGAEVLVLPKLYKDPNSRYNFVALADGRGYVAREFLIEPKPEQVIVVRYVNDAAGVNVRVQPTVKGKLLRAISFRTRIEVDATLIDDPASDHAFRRLADGSGYVADTFLSANPPPIIITPSPAPARNRIGWHILPGAPAEMLNVLSRLHQANRPVPLITLVFINGQAAFTVEEIKKRSPRTIVIARDLRGGDYHAEDKGGWDRTTRADGRDYYNANKSGITADMRRADYIQIRDLNEPGEGTGINAWMMGMLDAADADNVKACVYNFSVGNPGLPGDNRPYADFWKWASTWELLRRVKRDGHAFCLHQYTNGSWKDESTILRHRRIYRELPPDLQDLKLWMNECGESYKFPGTRPDRDSGRYAAEISDLQKSLRGDPGDPDVALWNFGHGSDEWIPDKLDHLIHDGTYERAVRDQVLVT